MTAPNQNFPGHHAAGPTPEQLLAYADGQLDPHTSEQVSRWLDSHPEARAEVEAQRRLLSLFHDNPAPEPSPGAWDETLVRIHAGLTQGTPPRSNPRLPRLWGGGAGARFLLGLFAAAALFAGTLAARPLLRSWWQAGPQAKTQPADELSQEADEPFPVASAQEVNVLSVDGRDADSIVLWPPLLGSFDLVEPGDVESVAVSPHPVHGWLARLEDGPVPMFLAGGPDEP